MRVVIIEQDEKIRTCLASVLEYLDNIKVVGTGVDGYEGIKLVECVMPDIVILDVNDPIGGGFKIIPSIKLRSPNTAIILIVDNCTEKLLMSVFTYGIRSVIKRKYVYEDIIHAIRNMTESQTSYYFHKQIVNNIANLAARLVEEDAKRSGMIDKTTIKIPEKILSRAEIEVVAHIGEGLTNKEIAVELDVSEGTIRNYVSTILKKAGLKHRTQIGIYSYINGFSCEPEFLKFKSVAQEPNSKKLTAKASDVRLKRDISCKKSSSQSI